MHTAATLSECCAAKSLINRLIVLTIVTKEQPFDLRKFARQALQIAALVLATAAEPAISCRSPVGEQQRTGGIKVSRQKASQGWRDVPGAR